MRISVECGGFTKAADACLTANQTAAVLTESLASRLSSHAGMAGNDATSAGFAASYDTGATEALAALADLTHAFIGAGRLLAATGRHHAVAEAGAAGLRTSAYVGGDLHENDYVRVQPAAPPSTLGGQEPSLGRIDAWILDQVEGFVWPGADVEGLRTAATDWRRAAATTSRLADHVDAAVALVEQQRSPEVPLAVDALTDLAGLIGDTAWQLSTVASACEEYAAAVEEARERTRALLAEIAQMVVEGAAVTALVAGVTGGLGGSAALAAAAARVRAQAPRFHALLLALRASTTTAAARPCPGRPGAHPFAGRAVHPRTGAQRAREHEGAGRLGWQCSYARARPSRGGGREAQQLRPTSLQGRGQRQTCRRRHHHGRHAP